MCEAAIRSDNFPRWYRVHFDQSPDWRPRFLRVFAYNAYDARAQAEIQIRAVESRVEFYIRAVQPDYPPTTV